MKTSYFYGPYHKAPGAIAISRKVPPGWPAARHFKLLAPPMAMVNEFKLHEKDEYKGMSWPDYREIYNWYLDALPIEKVWQRLTYFGDPYADPADAAEEIVLMCWCRPRRVDGALRCHRRLVAEAFERRLGHKVPEAAV